MGVTARDIREYYEAFSEFDKDRSGSINTSELGNVFRSLGENPTSMELEVRERRVQCLSDIVTTSGLELPANDSNIRTFG